jgi:hypothetical protein
VSYLAYIGIAVVVAGILESGILLSLVVLGLSVSLMMLGEAFEMFHNANVFTKAVRNNISFGKGDFDVLSILKSVLPKLSAYYLLLAIGFFACGATLSYTMPQALLLFAQLFGVSLEVASRGIGLVAPWFIVFILVFVALLAQIALGDLKNRFFGFLPSTSLDSIGRQFEMMKQFVHWHHHELAHRAPPEPEQMPDSERERP